MSSQVVQRVKEGILIALGGVALFLVIALWSHHPSDPGWSHTGTAAPLRNHGGIVGAWIADIALYLFGGFAFVFPIMIAFAGWVIFREREDDAGWDYFHLSVRGIGFVLTLIMGCGLIWVRLRGALGELPHQRLRFHRIVLHEEVDHLPDMIRVGIGDPLR